MKNLERVLQVRLTEEMFHALEGAAQEDERKPSGYARKVIAEHLRKRGYLKPNPSSGRKG